MDETKTFRMGLIGCGRISQAYVQAIGACPQIDLVAVMDVRPEAAQSAAEAESCGAFHDLEAMISEGGLEGAIICAPPVEHRAIACRLLEAGIHVLCEKPFATTADDAAAMVATAQGAERVLMMASKFRYVEDLIRAKAMITSGLLGEIQFYENKFCAKVNMRGRWNADPKIAGGGVLIDNGTHSVDIARYLLGPVTRIHAQEGKRVMGLDVDETAWLSFNTASGVMGSVCLSWSLNSDGNDYIKLIGTDGALRIGWQESQFQHNGHPEWVSFGVGFNKVEAFKKQVTNFVGTVRGSAEPIITSDDGLASVQVIEAAYRSMREGQWIEIEDTPSLPNLIALS